MKRLPTIIRQLEDYYGSPELPQPSGPFEMILYEIIAYLVEDDRRLAAFNALRDLTGFEPERILAAPQADLLQVAKIGGDINTAGRINKIKTAARMAIDDYAGDLSAVLLRPPLQARRALMRFPGIGEPGAEKILLFSRTEQVLALESNGLRALARIGYGHELPNYAETYRTTQEAAKDELVADYDWLIRAHLLLRLHGQELCRRSDPVCSACPVKNACKYYAEHIRLEN